MWGEFMIDDPHPAEWRELQAGVCRLFCDIGLTAATDVPLRTPRGSVNVDVHAIDENSVDRIQYIVECKNWGSAIPQSIVHSFTTVMHETGANIGFIVSQKGLQSGAVDYTANTNIRGLTYAELQQRYMTVWWRRHFCVQLAKAAEDLHGYSEPINSFRDKRFELHSEDRKNDFVRLYNHSAPFGMLMYLLDVGTYAPQYASDPPDGIDNYKAKFVSVMGEDFRFHSLYYRDLLVELRLKIASITEQFHAVFGRNIFEEG
jgi:restriction system protein